MLTDWKSQVRVRLEELKLDMKAASRKAGKGETFVRDMLERDRSPSIDNFLLLARALELEPAALLKPDITSRTFRTRPVPLKGYIGAGGDVVAVGTGEEEPFDAPETAHEDTVAAVVRGRSMLPVYAENTVIFWSKLLPPSEMINRRCVVQLADERIMVKMLRAGRSEGLWNLESFNPAYETIEDVPVQWAAKIDWVKEP